MINRYRAILLILTFAALPLFIGCSGSDDDVLAVVGTDNITVEDFKLYSRNLSQSFASAQEEFDRNRALLDTMIASRLLVQAAYEYGLDKSEEVARVILANKDKFLLDILYQKHILDKIEVTQAEDKEFHEMLEYKIRAYQIVVKDVDTAQMLFERARAGENFEQLAYDYSTDADAKRNRGDLGYFVWGAMVKEFQEAAFQMQPGELSPPVKTRYGYHIIKLIDKQTNELRTSFADMKQSIDRQIRNRKQFYKTEKFFEMIKAKYPITIDTATCDYVMFKREQLYPPQILSNMPRSDFDTDQLDRNEKELPIATWQGGMVSLNEYLTAVQQVPVQLRPDLDDYGAIPELVFEIKKQEILAYEANTEGLENDEQFKKQLNLFKELAMGDLIRLDSIKPAVAVTEAMARAYFEQERAKYITPRKIHLYEILTSDELLANRLSKEIKSFGNFTKQAQKYTERPAQRNTDGDLGYIERRFFKEVFPVAWNTPVGKMGGPVATLGKHSLFWVVDRLEEQLSDFLTVKRQITAILERDQRLKAYGLWIEKRKAETAVEVFEDAIWSAIDADKYAAVTTGGTSTN